MSGGIEFLSIVEKLDEGAYSRLFVSEGRVQIWNKKGVLANIEKLFRNIMGQFDANTVARQVYRELKKIEAVGIGYVDNPLLFKKLIDLSESYSLADHVEASNLVQSAANDVFRPVHSEKSLERFFNNRKLEWLEKYGYQFKFDFNQINYAVYLPGGKKSGMSTWEVINEFDRFANRVNFMRNEINRLEMEFSDNRNKYETRVLFDEVRKEFEVKYLPAVLNYENKRDSEDGVGKEFEVNYLLAGLNRRLIKTTRQWAKEKMVEKCFSKLVDQMLAGFPQISEKDRLDLIAKYFELYKAKTPLEELRIQLKSELESRFQSAAGRA